MEFENLGQLYLPFLKIFYDEKRSMFTLLSSYHKSDIFEICHDTKKQISQGVSRGFITAQPIKFSMQLGTTFYLSFITLTFFFI